MILNMFTGRQTHRPRWVLCLQALNFPEISWEPLFVVSVSFEFPFFFSGPFLRLSTSKELTALFHSVPREVSFMCLYWTQICICLFCPLLLVLTSGWIQSAHTHTHTHSTPCCPIVLFSLEKDKCMGVAVIWIPFIGGGFHGGRIFWAATPNTMWEYFS